MEHERPQHMIDFDEDLVGDVSVRPNDATADKLWQTHQDTRREKSKATRTCQDAKQPTFHYSLRGFTQGVTANNKLARSTATVHTDLGNP